MPAAIRFDSHSITEHWSNFPEIKSLFARISDVEKWVLDFDAETALKIENWVEEIDDKLDVIKTNHPALLTLLAFMSVSSSMYLLQKLEERIPGLISNLSLSASDMAENEKYGRQSRILIERLAAAHTQVSLSQLLNNKRLALVYAAIDKVQKRKGSSL
ncbi:MULTISPECIES: type IVB secretion system protein IcmW [Alteromonas]|jgi:hypothetical protein|uniref:Uncharacterized protein n=1 Tax=Alteromonas macleodii TaxID=28108 RepID=A0AB36FKC7_ALTMA|nr:hypothetical protein [Alteromonas macleodii]OES23870.1 hypothetical protein BFV95_4955 [Alteromonas macleodii]OES24575.1 hypothetical protein BFV94_4726 [Alteromonas macleodii]OES25586.1 hypothetical protein BFV93_4340 [Alteromonas macleodii]OES38994.1 hypothetical protein BFV96_4395 [Alteromonas macleodii]|tara:strand:+ start:5360 stop:5836 length:477 start_codon:yes stop_codon:yes gene_type:complete